MNKDFTDLIRQATASTRNGDLTMATRRIQEALAGMPGAGVPGSSSTQPLNWRSMLREPADAGGIRADPAMISGSFANAAGSRNYRLFVPAQQPVHPMPLVVVLHGCTQDPDDMAVGTGFNEAASQHGFCVLYPEQSVAANQRRCWNWFEADHQRTETGEPAIIAGMTQDVIARHAIDARRVYLCGMSSGGAMAALLAFTHPVMFEAIGVHSGLAPGSASNLASGLQAMRRASSATFAPRPDNRRIARMIVFHGDSDRIVDRSNAEQLVANWLEHAAVGPPAGNPESCKEEQGMAGAGRQASRTVWRNDQQRILLERWIVHGAGHAWSGGRRPGTHTDPLGPDATGAMVRFFLTDLEA